MCEVAMPAEIGPRPPQQRHCVDIGDVRRQHQNRGTLRCNFLESRPGQEQSNEGMREIIQLTNLSASTMNWGKK